MQNIFIWCMLPKQPQQTNWIENKKKYSKNETTFKKNNEYLTWVNNQQKVLVKVNICNRKVDGGLYTKSSWETVHATFQSACYCSVLFVFLFLIMFLAKTKTASWRRCNWNDLLDSFVLFIFQGVQVNPSRYNLTFYTARIIIIYILEQLINLPWRFSEEWNFFFATKPTSYENCYFYNV